MCFITWILAPFKNFVTDLFKNDGGSVLFLDVLPVVLECLNVGSVPAMRCGEREYPLPAAD